MSGSYPARFPRDKSLLFHIHTLWLFNRSDLKTVVGPQIVFGLVSAFSGSRLTTNTDPTLSQIAARLPHLVLWIWSNLLTETVANQRLQSSIVEDAVNKPWRPLPTQRLTPDGARRLLLVLVPVVSLISFLLGGLQATVALQVFSYMYNDLDGANQYFVVRNVLNACGIACFSVGAASVMANFSTYTLDQRAYEWIAILSTVIFSTVHIQDLPDIEGDRTRGRETIPLLYGQAVARWSVAIMIAGKVVRFGPNRISINSNTALQDIYGINSNVQRSQVYVSTEWFFGGEPSSNTTLNWRDHAFRRRINVQAINPTTIKNLEERILRNIRFFAEHLVNDNATGWSKAKDMSKQFGYLVSDIMGDVIFGRRWETMRKPDNRDLLTKLPEAVAGIHLTGYMPQLYTSGLHRLLFRRITQGVDRFTALATEMFEWRLSHDHRDDLFGALLQTRDAESGKGLSTAQLVSEAGLFIVAGSDTTITATTATLFYLLHYPSALDRLQEEIRNTFTDADEIRIGAKLSSCEYLYACIDETMRLTPSVGATLMREVLPGGLVVDGEWFPPGTDIGVPHYALHHNEAYFAEPFVFKPQRWFEDEYSFRSREVEVSPNNESSSRKQEKGVRAGSAFTPFGVGRASCIGKYLAYQEMSLTLTYMIWMYDMRLEPGSTAGEGNAKLEPGRQRKNEFQTLDRFIMMHDGPMVEFKSRFGQ
ncbi:hypothetical protein ACLMJK_008170 [Lecanora helva]